MVTFSAPFLRQGSKAGGTPLVLGIQPPAPMVCFMLHVPLQVPSLFHPFPSKRLLGIPCLLPPSPTGQHMAISLTITLEIRSPFHRCTQTISSTHHCYTHTITQWLEYSLALSDVPIIEQLQKHILILLQKTHLPAFSLTSSLTQTNPVVKTT